MRQPWRCRKCGNQYADSIWLPQHPGVSLERGQTPKPHDVCSVENKHNAQGYPLKDGERHKK
jgi:ribosomal protein L37AE/L43A